MACLESCFPLVFFADPNIVVSLSYIEFTEDFHALKIFYALCQVGEQCHILLSDCIERSVVDNVALFVTVFLGYLECGKPIWRI